MPFTSSLLSIFIGSSVGAQAPAVARTTDESAYLVRELIAEVRALRESMERRADIASNAQVIVARLTLQEQRVARARAAVEAHESRLTALRAEESEFRGNLGALEKFLEETTATDRRAQIEGEKRVVTARLSALDAQIDDVTSRRGIAQVELDTAQARLEEIDASLERWLSHGRR